MNEQFVLELKKLLNCFPESYINRNLEVILIPKTNTYFSLAGCITRRDIIAEVLMWCTRDIAKVRPYQQQRRNIAFYVDNRTRLEKYLGSSINVDVVYHHLGNGINKELTYQFIDSGFDMDLLFDKEVEE
jgi:hypothetical protein